VPPHLRLKLRQLAVLAQRNRAKIRPDSPQALASKELTELARTLRRQGVPTTAIANAAGISYRAMHRRLTST
jgi:DNA invertase Pin-like site-specific DNA recombinase